MLLVGRSLKMTRRRTIVLVMGIAVVAVIGWIGMQRQPTEKVLGDHETQPPTAVTRLSTGEPGDLQPVIASAKKSVAAFTDRMWAEPVQITEREHHWDVSFKYREKLIEVDGRRLVEKRVPGGCKIEVSKSDLTARLIPAR
jgi:hypothetical protein